MLRHLSFPGDHKALQINSEQRNWQQSHYCSRIGDKALRALQGTACGLSAAIWKWSLHRKMRVLPENVWNLCDLSEQTHREYQQTSSEKRQTGFSPSCSSSHDMIQPGPSLFISPPPHCSLPKHRSPSPPPAPRRRMEDVLTKGYYSTFSVSSSRRWTSWLILSRMDLQTMLYEGESNMGALLGDDLHFLEAEGTQLSLWEAYVWGQLRLLSSLRFCLLFLSTFKSRKRTLWDGFYFQDSPKKAKQLLSERINCLKWSFCAAKYLSSSCHCFCEKMQITVSWGWAGQLPAESMSSCTNVKQAVWKTTCTCSVKALAGENKANKTSQQSHRGKLALCWRFLPIISDYLALNAVCSLKTIVPNVRKLPWSCYHGILVNSMQALDVICILSFHERVVKMSTNCHCFKPGGVRVTTQSV